MSPQCRKRGAFQPGSDSGKVRFQRKPDREADNSRGHVADEGVTVKATERSRERLMVIGLGRNSAQATPNAREAQQSSNPLRTTDTSATSTSYVKWDGRRTLHPEPHRKHVVTDVSLCREK